MKPQPKVAAAGVGGAVTVLVVWVLGQAGMDVPAEIAAAISTVVGFAAGYLKQ